MNRRSFLRGLGALVGAIALAPATALAELERTGGSASWLEWQEGESPWSRIPEGRKDAFYAYGTIYVQSMTLRPNSAWAMV